VVTEKTAVASCKLHGVWLLALLLLGTHQVDIVSFNAAAAVCRWHHSLRPGFAEDDVLYVVSHHFPSG
jgi:hypothetical protein